MTTLFLKRFVKNYDDVKNPEVRERYAILSGGVGIFVNFLLFASKLVAGLLTASISITADALNNLTDAGSSVVSLFSIKLANAAPDKDHPFGHGRIEYLAGFIISVIIMLMGFELGKTSVEKIISPEEISFNLVAIIILLCSILLKIWLGFFNRSLGNRINSAPLKAVFADSISDVISTAAVLIGALVFHFFSINIDGYIGLAVAVLILINGVKTALDSFSPILGTLPENELVEEIVRTVTDYDEVVGVHDLIIHNYGVGVIIVSLHAELPSDMSFTEAHEIIDEIEIALKEKFRCEATIHMDPIDVNDEFTDSVRKKVAVLVSSIDPRLTIHDFRLTTGNSFNNVIFDVVVPFGFAIPDSELVDRITQSVNTLDEKYRVKITLDRSMV